MTSIQQRLRAEATTLRIKSMPLKHLIPLLSQSADHIDKVEAEVATLKAERDALLKDAERYRWLVKNSFDKQGVTQMHCWLHTWEPQQWKQRIRGPALDIFIDAAIAKAEGGAV